MPGLHSAMSRHLFTLNGNVLTSGGAKNLAKGQFTIIKSGTASANGATVVSNFAGLSPHTSLEMRVGKHKVGEVRTARNAKPYTSENFKITDVVRVKGNSPKFSEQKFDDLIIGFDGINDDTAIELEEGQTTVMDVVLSGGHVEFVTGQKEHVFKVHFGREKGETNQEMIQRVVEIIRSKTLPQGVAITDLVSVKIVDSENEALSGTEYVFSTLEISDSGDSNSLGDVQAQYPEQNVKVTGRVGQKTTYTIMHPVADTPADFKQTVASYPKGCEDCAADYSQVTGGVIYSIKLEDDGEDLTSTIQAITANVATTAKKKGQKEGFGSYTVVTTRDLTPAEVTSFMNTAITSTAIVEKMGDVKAICQDTTVTTTAWTTGESCYASVQSYKIQLKDDDCDGSVLGQLQAAYPDLNIQAGTPTSANQSVTVVSGGNLTVVINGQAYETTFDTDDATTTTEFFTEHSADILTDQGLTVTNPSAGELVFTGAVDFASISAAGQTVGDVSYTTTTEEGGCQALYSTQVVTNIVCDECDDIFLDKFVSKAPQPFNFTEWEAIKPIPNGTSKMGIRFTGKPFIMTPTEATRDQIPFYETSTRIKVSGGYVEETSNSFDPIYSDIFSVKRLSRAQDRDNLGWHLLPWEEASRYYFDGEVRKRDNLFAKAVYGQESILKFDAQYVSYEVTIHDSRYSQAAGQRSDMGTTYVIWAEFGKHNEIEDYVNSIAVKAGLEPVQVAPR